jgi:ferredoxin-NADP reductase
MVKFAADSRLDTDMVLIYANRSIKDIVFRDDFETMQRVWPKLKVAHVLCEVEPGFKCIPGQINARVVKDEVTDYPERQFFLCGPPAMVEAMRKLLTEELELPQERIVTENFQGY